MQYSKGKHCVYYHRYHIVWSTKYRFKVLTGDLRLRIRDVIRQVCAENDVDIINGVLSSDHVHMFVSVPPKLAISDLVRKMKAARHTKCCASFQHSESDTGANGFGAAATSLQRTELSLRMWYFST